MPVRNVVHLGVGAFIKESPLGEGKPMSEVDDIPLPSLKGTLDDLHWWTQATAAARSKNAD
ncbi:MAG: hypothetical protein Q4G22_04220 [Paracoccus sp. (in: a-proteobacteria)]|nr:hypothetical protein [Paracoccus sp. (in: a-proteobacteria)]MDO5631023.1 hypothetical protein [Paracoccus sp. (in: a-proteobacteria)]